MAEETGSKKWVLVGLAGAVIGLSAVAAAVPSTREYIISIVKILLVIIRGIAQ